MFTSFSTALSALTANSTAVDVVGNNLANLNTPGFKTSVVYFRDLVTESLGAGLGETQVGFGTGTPLTVRQFTQGAIQTSTGLLDAAVQGDGFFVVKNAPAIRSTPAPAISRWTTPAICKPIPETRCRAGLRSTPQPERWTPMAPSATSWCRWASQAAVATSQFTKDFNLNSNAAADSTSAFSDTIKVYDSLGSRTS